jgi:uncharacterized protein (TIGR02597 family)
MNVAVRRFPLLLVSLLAILPLRPIHAQSVATNPVGYNVFSLPKGSSILVNTFVQPTAYQSTAASYTSASNSVVTVSNSGSTLTSGSFNETGAEPSYFMEILSGSSTGLIVDVLSNTASTITVNANLSSFGVSGTTSFCIRPHTTLASLFPPGSGLTANIDLLKLYFPNKTSQTYEYTTSYSDGWMNVNTFADAGSQIIYPGQGFILVTQSTESVPIMGTVKPGPTIVPLYAGAANIVGTINPLLTGTQTLSTYGFPAYLTQNLDLVETYSSDGAFTSQTSESNGTNMFNINTFADTDTVSVPPSNAVIVTTQQNEYYTMPSFYTSGN